MKPLTLKSFIPGIIWFLVILVLICTPGNELPEPKGWWQWINLIHIDKLIHMGIFAVLVILFSWPVARGPFSRKEKWRIFLWISLAGCAWGLGTELIQKFFIPSRSFDMMDWTADSIGALAAIFFNKAFLLNRFPHAEER